MSSLLRLRSIWYRQTPCNLKRANAHAKRRELSTSVLDYVWNCADFDRTRNKSGRSVYVLFIILAHRQILSSSLRLIYQLFTITCDVFILILLSDANIRSFSYTSKYLWKKVDHTHGSHCERCVLNSPKFLENIFVSRK